MKLADDISRLWEAEREAEQVLVDAREETLRVRRDTDARVAKIAESLDAELAAMREKAQADNARWAATLAEQSRERTARACRAVDEKLKAGRSEAVALVVAELTKTS